MSDFPLLSVNNIRAGYGKGNVLRGLSLRVEDGEAVALLGRNGAGKTTTLRAIAGVIQPDQGSIEFDGEDITTLADYEKSNRGISYVAEERSIFPDLTVAENLRLGTVKGGEGIYTIQEVYELLPRLEERKSLPASHLSGGEQQMLVIARALLSETKILLLDEPTEGLAPKIVRDVLDMIEHIRDQDIPILLVEQNLNAVLEVADQTYVINKGEIAFEGTAEELEADESVQDQHLGVGASVGEDF
jgi:branched-chain amino acid transport system ATP-binding protein